MGKTIKTEQSKPTILLGTRNGDILDAVVYTGGGGGGGVSPISPEASKFKRIPTEFTTDKTMPTESDTFTPMARKA